MTQDEPATRGGSRSAQVIGWLAVLLCTAAAILAGLLTSFFIPLYAGSAIVPVAPLAAIASNVVLPWLGRQAVGRAAGAALPFLGWLVTVIGLSSGVRPEGDVVFPGGGGALPWVSYGVILGGGLAGAVTLVLSSPALRSRDRLERDGARALPPAWDGSSS
jgi:hypothetical protein